MLGIFINFVYKVVFDLLVLVKFEFFLKFFGIVCLKVDFNDVSFLCNEFNLVLNFLFLDYYFLFFLLYYKCILR